MRKNTITWLLIGAALMAGCAKENATSDNADNKAYIEAWLKAKHPGVSASGIGIYILDEKPGTGKTYNGEDFAYLRFTTRDMDGNILTTSEARISQQLGTYDKSYFYGPAVIPMDEASCKVGVEALLTGMKVGGTRTALVPSWLMGYKRYDDAEEYFKKADAEDYSNTIYSITLEDCFDDEIQWELDSLSRFIAASVPGATLVDEGLYYVRRKNPTKETTIPSDSTIYINYTGRLLNGQVFDTTIKDTAKVYGIYSSSKTYSPVAITFSDSDTELKMGSGNVVAGFSKTIFRMRPYEHGTGYFISSYGYSSSGSGNRIPSYSPLRFDIELVDKP